MATTLADIPPHIIRTHILPRLDGPSLSTTATASSHLNALCSDDTLWSHISKTTWPSITHPRLHDIISTFPSGHRSFFDDSFPSLVTDVTDVTHPRRSISRSHSSPCDPHPSPNPNPNPNPPSEIISAFDIRYQNQIIYSGVNFTPITNDFLSSPFRIALRSQDNRYGVSEQVIGVSRSIDLTVDEIAGADKQTLFHLKDSISLTWILIDPTRKRAANISSIKPFGARQDWVGNETHLRYVTVLPGSDPGEIVQCRIQVVMGVGEKGVGLYVKEVVLKLQDLDCTCLNGMEGLTVMEGAMVGVTRKVVVDDEERWKGYRVFKKLKMEKKEWERKMERRTEILIYFNYLAIFVTFFFCVYFFFLLIS